MYRILGFFWKASDDCSLFYWQRSQINLQKLFEWERNIVLEDRVSYNTSHVRLSFRRPHKLSIFLPLQTTFFTHRDGDFVDLLDCHSCDSAMISYRRASAIICTCNIDCIRTKARFFLLNRISSAIRSAGTKTTSRGQNFKFNQAMTV